MQTKICTQCGKEKEISEFHFRKERNKYQNYCKDCVNIKLRILYLKNKDKRLLYSKQYSKTHKKERNKHCKDRRKIDIHFKIVGNLRSRLCVCIRSNIKSKKTLELLGCSIEFLKKHLESQFKKDMNWNNHGCGWGNKGMKEWHIDHIYPCSSFNLSKPEEQQVCFHWSNLQPMWASINREKHNKLI